MQGDISKKADDNKTVHIGDFGIGAVNRLNAKNLNEVIIAGDYQQDATNEATIERNYPIKEAGALRVIQTVGEWGAGGVIQEYTTYLSARKFIRVRASATWYSWQELPNRHSNETQFFNGQVVSYNGVYVFDKSSPSDYFGLLRAVKGNAYGFFLSYDGVGYSIRFPEKKGGTMMLVGDYGWGGSETPSTNISEAELRAVLMNRNTVTQIIRNEQTTKYGLGGSPIAYFKSKDTYQALVSSWNGGSCRVVAGNATSEYVHNLWTDRNTTVDSNGFIKRASPIIDINPDGTFTTNDESEGATVARVAQGEYLIEGVLGFNADAGWGGVDGGIEIPLDVNKQPLIWVDSEVMEDGSILVKTYHRTHPNAPKFARNDIDGFNDGDPIDIPDGRFIFVRVQMPEQSIYNVRMREMEEAQKAEEERRQKEEEENQDTNKTPEIYN
nr:pyocin knob domain-containing protein [Proteus sp. PR00174]